METWLKDLVLNSNLLEKDSLTSLRIMLGSDVPEHQKEHLSKIFLNLEKNEITKEAFLEDLVSKLGYKEVAKMVLDLYTLMETQENFASEKESPAQWSV